MIARGSIESFKHDYVSFRFQTKTKVSNLFENENDKEAHLIQVKWKPN